MLIFRVISFVISGSYCSFWLCLVLCRIIPNPTRKNRLNFSTSLVCIFHHLYPHTSMHPTWCSTRSPQVILENKCCILRHPAWKKARNIFKLFFWELAQFALSGQGVWSMTISSTCGMSFVHEAWETTICHPFLTPKKQKNKHLLSSQARRDDNDDFGLHAADFADREIVWRRDVLQIGRWDWIFFESFELRRHHVLDSRSTPIFSHDFYQTFEAQKCDEFV